MPDWIRGFLADKSSRTASRTAPELGAWGWRLGDWYCKRCGGHFLRADVVGHLDDDGTGPTVAETMEGAAQDTRPPCRASR